MIRTSFIENVVDPAPAEVVIATAVAFASVDPLGDVLIATAGGLVYPNPSLISVIVLTPPSVVIPLLNDAVTPTPANVSVAIYPSSSALLSISVILVSMTASSYS